MRTTSIIHTVPAIFMRTTSIIHTVPAIFSSLTAILPPMLSYCHLTP